MRSPKAIDVGLAQRPHVSVRFSRGHPTMLHGFPWGDSSKDLFEIAPGAPWSLKTLERAPWVDKSGADSFFLRHNQLFSDLSSRAQCHQVWSERVCFVLSG